MANGSDFDDTDAQAFAYFLQYLEESQKPVREAARELIKGGVSGVLIPLRDDGEQLYAVAGTEVELAKVFETAEATLVALELGKRLAASQSELVVAVRASLAAAGNAAGLRLAVPGSDPKAFCVAGDLPSVASLCGGPSAEG